MIAFLTITLLIFILLVYITSVWKTTRQKDLHHLTEQEKKLIIEIELLTKSLEEQRNQLKNNQLNELTMLPCATNESLNVYERSNIRIPLDIIESLSYEQFHNESEAFNYIENQRNYWKLENTKKPYKG